MAPSDETNGEQNQNDSDTDDESTQKDCDACGEYVTRAYHRVFSDNDGVLHSCLHCSPKGTPRGGNR